MARKPPASPVDPDLAEFVNHEDTITFEMNGKVCHWLLCHRAFRRAEAAGHPIEELVEAVKSLKQAGATIAKAYGVYGMVVWFGRLTFEPDLKMETVTDLLTPNDIRTLGPLLLRPVLAAGKEGKAEAPTPETGSP